MWAFVQVLVVILVLRSGLPLYKTVDCKPPFLVKVTDGGFQVRRPVANASCAESEADCDEIDPCKAEGA